MPKCSIKSCRNNSDNVQGQNISFFSLPGRNPEVRKKWIDICKINDDSKSRRYVCSKHFTDSDFKQRPSYIKEYVDYTPKCRKLVDDAVPTIHLTEETIMEETTEEESEVCHTLPSNLVQVVLQPTTDQVNPQPSLIVKKKKSRRKSPMNIIRNVKIERIVCSEHFEKKDYVPPPAFLKNCVNYKPKLLPKLKPNVIPNKNLLLPIKVNNGCQNVKTNGNIIPSTVVNAIQHDHNAYTMMTNNIQNIVKQQPINLVHNDNMNKIIIINTPNTPNEKVKFLIPQRLDNNNTPQNIMKINLPKSTNSVQTQTDKIKITLPLKIHQPKEEKTVSYEQYSKTKKENDNLKKQVALLAQTIASTEKTKRQWIKTELHNRLKHIFSPGQIKLILNPNQDRVKWSVNDIKSATELKKISIKAYKHLQKKKYPLPGLSTLRKYIIEERRANDKGISFNDKTVENEDSSSFMEDEAV